MLELFFFRSLRRFLDIVLEFGHLKVAYSSVHLCDGNGGKAKYTILSWPDS